MRIHIKLNKNRKRNNGQRTNIEKQSHYSDNNTKARIEKEIVNNYKEKPEYKKKEYPETYRG